MRVDPPHGETAADSTDRQREVTRLALAAVRGSDFALAGSGAIREHGVTDRLTEDVDLFTSDVDVDAFDRSVDAVVGRLRSDGYSVDLGRRAERFARLRVATGDGVEVDVDMGVDWRAAEPVMLSVGPVLSLEDAIGNKVSALYSRAEARDYLDVDAIRASGLIADRELIEAAAERDPGFDPAMFAAQLDGIARIGPERVAEYGVSADELRSVRARFTEWADRLRADLAAGSGTGASADPRG